MTSVNTRPQTPYTADYEQPRNWVPAGQENNPEATGSIGPQAYSEPPRGPMTPEQRGQFSTHSEIINPPQSQGADTAGELAELSQKNQNLADKYVALAERFSTKIVEFTKKIENLANQIIASGKQTEHAPGVSGSTPQGRRTDTPTVTPETPAMPDTQKTEQSQPSGLAALAKDISELKDAFDVLMKNFNNVMKVLTDKLNELTQLLSKGGAQNQTPPVQSDTIDTPPSVDAAPETMAPPQQDQKLAPANDSTAPAPGTLEYLKQENQRLEAQIDQMTAYFEATMSALEKQFETVTRQVNGQTK
ncbi:hypothetical protein [Pseudomonas costantinii]|uniref:Uncharacterized protein n=2 Tax=Pseudomonas costantinii TaxID=168469 RepID=A0A1H5CBW5_9PSED|nr:hypothetical protein [Pseudomonas costantinii]SED64273.1 hypothetical protein SAMN04515675_1861 [Pseudomonas costantinii]